ncbi:hypothetical protein WIC93_14395 [Enterobacter cloacae]|nr:MULTISPECIES: hypothetical protein [Enterobacter]MCL1517922.1 hypothetical protein [Enterobacter cloacae]MDK9971912.1 hypothetical protein [Enterobacter cloacae]MDK9976817.1 hypothetical protein [Enterobacter cloacae]MDL0014754.1 hypothetical protein [Enterobacter cloacae]MDO9654784.1 hypothetical protein [Enterobacter cloacae]
MTTGGHPPPISAEVFVNVQRRGLSAEMIMSLIKLTQQKIALESELVALKKNFTNESARISKEMASVLEKLNFVNSGLDDQKVSHGMRIVYFGNPKESSERRACISDAISDIATGFSRLRKEYLGTKNYAHWSDQRISCSYGCCPSHGSVCFEVGLTRQAREKASEHGLDDYDAECAIYCLMNVDAINAAKAEAREVS